MIMYLAALKSVPEQLYEAGGIVMLAEQLQSPSEGAQLQAVSALSQLSAAPAQSWLFPRHIFELGSTLVSNLCVSNAYRKEGVGRRLMDAVRAPDAPTYLLVAKPPSGASSDVRAAFESRVPRAPCVSCTGTPSPLVAPAR